MSTAAMEQGEYTLLEQWEGTIIDLRESEIDARLRDLTGANRPEEIATFDFEEVSDGDRSLVRPGAVFHWSIGFRVSRHGRKTRTFEVRFRRLPIDIGLSP